MESLSPRLSLQARMTLWCRAHHLWVLSIIGALLVTSAGIAMYLLLSLPHPQLTSTVAPPTTRHPAAAPTVYYSPLTGLPVANEAATQAPVTAIMIENSPQARPQSGLKQAGIVYEAIAEGGITRFLTLHQQDKPQLIGPVRSVRPYFVDWLTPYQASIAHVGGSAAALATVRNGSYRDLDEFFNGAYYWRSTDRYAPHNVYTSFAKLDALNQAKGYTSSVFTGFSRTDGTPSSTPNTTSIAINFSSALYNTSYQYDKASNSYLRSEGGQPHLDREDGQIAPTVVIAMHVDEQTVMQDGYREQIGTIGSGPATIFQNGTATNVTWHKPSQSTGISFTDASGHDVPLDRGQTWIAAVPNNTGSVSWQ